jgi:hypothetical protein
MSPLCAGIAQLVERNLAKVEVAGSNPVSRSTPRLGSVAEWACSGLQLRVRRFDSGPSLQYPPAPLLTWQRKLPET